MPSLRIGGENQPAGAFDCNKVIEYVLYHFSRKESFDLHKAIGLLLSYWSGKKMADGGSALITANSTKDTWTATAFGQGSSCMHPGGTLVAMVANPTEGFVGLDPSWVRLGDGQARTIRQFPAGPRQLAVSGSSGPGQLVPGLARLLGARMEELLQASRAPSTLKAH